LWKVSGSARHTALKNQKSQTMQIKIRNACQADFVHIVELNQDAVQHTSQMDLQRLSLLDQLAAYHKVATVDEHVAAFMFAMRDGANYVNDNFRWFSERLENFLYIDRIVVGAAFAGHKIGSAMYLDLFDFARGEGISQVVCEYNVQPPNPVSQAFHAKWGFSEIGTHWLDNGAKRVSLQRVKI